MNHKKITHIAIAGAALAAALACGAGGDDSDKAASNADGADTATGDKTAGLGQPARDGKFEFTVSKVDCTKTKIGTDLLGQTAQGKFCLVTLKVKNIGDEAQLFDASSQKALDKAGTTYDADGGAALYVNKNAETFLNNINPGNQIQGVLPFDVPKTVSITQLELHDGPFSDGVKVNITSK